MNKKISFVYFDVGGVIINNDHAIDAVVDKFNISKPDIDEFLSLHWDKLGNGSVTHEEFFALAEPLGISHSKNHWGDFVTDYQGIYKETHDLIEELHGTYRLGILSNAGLGDIELLIRKGKVPKGVWDTIIESAEHETLKPERKIYEIALESANVSPHEILFIDDREENIEAAKLMGWSGVVFDNHNVEKSIIEIKKVLGYEV